MAIPTTFSQDEIARATAEWSDIAGEQLKVENIKGFLYAFGTELAVRRLAHKFRSFNVRYSENLKRWYFCNERES